MMEFKSRTMWALLLRQFEVGEIGDIRDVFVGRNFMS